MSIDPDAPAPRAARPRRSSPAESSAPAEPSTPAEPDAGSVAADPTGQATRPADSPAPGGSRPESPSRAASKKPDLADADPTAGVEERHGAGGKSTRRSPASSSPVSSSRDSSGGARTPRRNRASRGSVGWQTALDDPAISTDGHGYRSFYLSDEVFARFRAAVYWTARRPEADGVPDNMSAGVEDYMEAIATDLENRFNEQAVFPPTPDQVRAHHRRQEGRGSEK